MLKALKNRKGFTLIELMIVVAIIGILAAVAVPVFLNYIRDSKTAEAKENLKTISDGALLYYQEEHADPADPLNVTTREYPVLNLVTAGNDPSGNKVAPDNAGAGWDDWKPLRFSISKPHYYSYAYVGTADTFTVTATASLDEADDSVFDITGSVNSGNPQVGATVDRSP